MSNRIVITIAVILSVAVIAGAGVAYAYQTDYKEDSPETVVLPLSYIQLDKTADHGAVPQNIVLRYSTSNVTPGSDEAIVIDQENTIEVQASDDASPLVFTESGGVFSAKDAEKGREYRIVFDDSGELESALLIMSMGVFSVESSNVTGNIVVTAALAENEDPEHVVSLYLAQGDLDLSMDGPVITIEGGTVKAFAAIDISAGITTDGEYGTATVPVMTLSLTAVPEDQS